MLAQCMDGTILPAFSSVVCRSNLSLANILVNEFQEGVANLFKGETYQKVRIS